MVYMQSIYQRYEKYMTIKKRVEPTVDSYILKGDQVNADKIEFANILLRLPKKVIRQIDERRGWKKRTPWIIEAILEKLYQQ